MPVQLKHFALIRSTKYSLLISYIDRVPLQWGSIGLCYIKALYLLSDKCVYSFCVFAFAVCSLCVTSFVTKHIICAEAFVCIEMLNMNSVQSIRWRKKAFCLLERSRHWIPIKSIKFNMLGISKLFTFSSTHMRAIEAFSNRIEVFHVCRSYENSHALNKTYFPFAIDQCRVQFQWYAQWAAHNL